GVSDPVLTRHVRVVRLAVARAETIDRVPSVRSRHPHHDHVVARDVRSRELVDDVSLGLRAVLRSGYYDEPASHGKPPPASFWRAGLFNAGRPSPDRRGVTPPPPVSPSVSRFPGTRRHAACCPPGDGTSRAGCPRRSGPARGRSPQG